MASTAPSYSFLTADADGIKFTTAPDSESGYPGIYRQNQIQTYAAIGANDQYIWNDVTSGRSVNTIYTNTGYLRMVSIFTYLYNGYGNSLQVQDPDTLEFITTATAAYPAAGYPDAYIYASISTIVKPTQSYRLVAATGYTSFFTNWMELR